MEPPDTLNSYRHHQSKPERAPVTSGIGPYRSCLMCEEDIIRTRCNRDLRDQPSPPGSCARLLQDIYQPSDASLDGSIYTTDFEHFRCHLLSVATRLYPSDQPDCHLA